MVAGWAARRLWRDAAALVYLTIPFAALAATFLILGRLTGGGDALDYLVYAVATGMLWAAVIVGYLAWIVLRDGRAYILTPSSCAIEGVRAALGRHLPAAPSRVRFP